MACAFQSGTSSVYLEIQWWFIKAPEEQNVSGEETGWQVASPGARRLRASLLCAVVRLLSIAALKLFGFVQRFRTFPF